MAQGKDFKNQKPLRGLGNRCGMRSKGPALYEVLAFSDSWIQRARIPIYKPRSHGLRGKIVLYQIPDPRKNGFSFLMGRNRFFLPGNVALV
jgi:hypothetical protein